MVAGMAVPEAYECHATERISDEHTLGARPPCPPSPQLVPGLPHVILIKSGALI